MPTSKRERARKAKKAAYAEADKIAARKGQSGEGEGNG